MMHSWPAAILLTITLALSAASGIADTQLPATADDPKPQLSRDSVAVIDGSMEGVVQRFSVPGLAVGIVEDGVPVYVRAFGVRDIDNGEPVTVHTLFHVGSITKAFTAAAVMQQVERNGLSLAGLQDTDFNALGAAIESTSKESFTQYLQSKVLAAAGMTESTFDAPQASDNIAWPHTGKIFVRRASRYPWDRALLPSAGLNSSISDMTRWAAVHVNRDPALLSPASYEALFKLQLDSGSQDMAMGLGWQLEKRGDDWLPRHAGAEHGFSSLLTLYPEQRRAIVILSNGETTPHGEIRDLIEAVLKGEPYITPLPPPLLRADFQWTLAGLVCMTALLIAVTVRFRRRPRCKA